MGNVPGLIKVANGKYVVVISKLIEGASYVGSTGEDDLSFGGSS